MWMCALHCEAKPLIDRFGLRKVPRGQGFDSYQNGRHCCVVSGIGAINMAAATAWAATSYNESSLKIWINLGIAGHQTQPLGELLQVSEFSSLDQPRVFKTPAINGLAIEPSALCSYPGEQQHYPDHCLVDMEGYAFVATASRFSDLKWCHSLKVISDNQQTPPTRDKNAISQLIENKLPIIEQFADQVQQQMEAPS